ncbi:MAG: alpha/beta fold hydrolase [Acidobacteriota bacterium]
MTFPVLGQDITGDWLGILDPGTIKLRIVFHITNAPDGLEATLDSPDQNARGIPITTVSQNGSQVLLEIKSLSASYKGTVNPVMTSIDGTFTQGGASFPLVLNRIEDTSALERRRPQNPEKPYPYDEEDVVYENGSAGINLGGTLTIPSGSGPFPAVVLISGSGVQDRDESILGHKPFLVLADHLTRNGIAALRSDDRGIGKSGGDPNLATTADFATDAEAAVAFLETRPEVDKKKIGLIGHSEGGLIAPMAASRNDHISFIVMMAGTGVPGDEILEEQVRLILEASGVRGAELEEAVRIQRESLALIKEEKDPEKLQKSLQEKLAGQMPEGLLKNQLNAINTAWFRYFLEYDPADALKKVRCPVLAIGGEKDLQVPPGQNLPAIRAALQEGGNSNFKVIEFPGLNHLFQTAGTGHPNEYGEIEETISPVVLDTISDWILSLK